MKINQLAFATVTALCIAWSTFAFAEKTVDREQMIKAVQVEIAQHTGVSGNYNEETQIVTLSGTSNDRAGFEAIVARIKKIEGVKEVRSSVSFK